MKTVLSKKTLGTEADFIIEDEMGKWSNDISSADYVIGDSQHSRCVDPLLKLYGVDLPVITPEKYVAAMKQVCDGPVPWRYVIPRKEYVEKFRKLVAASQEAVSEVSKNEYSNFFLTSNLVFSHLSKSTVNLNVLQSYLDANDVAALRSLRDMLKGDLLPPPVYNRVSTKTGRLTISKGPQILTLKKEFRNIFTSSHQGGSLFEIDFISLEPRVALNLAGKHGDEDDVYRWFISKNNLDISRDTAKLAVLCALYGAGTSKLESVLRQDSSKVSARQLISTVTNFFGISRLLESLRSQAPSGYITNYFGRPIEVDDARGSMLVNNFLQSTAADLAIAAFSEFTKDKAFDAKPLFIIHDALIIDVHPDKEAALCEFVKGGFKHEQLGHFPLNLKRLS